MISVIILTICALIDLYILLNTHEKVRTRKDRNQYWNMFPWVYKGRYKYPLYIWIIAILCCSFSATIAIISTGIAIIFLFISCMSENDYNYYKELEESKRFLKAPAFFKFFKFLKYKI